MRLSIFQRRGTCALLGAAFVLIAAIADADGTSRGGPTPATSVEILRAIDGHVQDLHTIVAKGEPLSDVHLHALAIRNLVRVLPARSQNLPEAALAKVKEQRKFVDTLAERLDQTGDANDKAGVGSNLEKLEAVLKSIRGQYPPK